MVAAVAASAPLAGPPLSAALVAVLPSPAEQPAPPPTPPVDAWRAEDFVVEEPAQARAAGQQVVADTCMPQETLWELSAGRGRGRGIMLQP